MTLKDWKRDMRRTLKKEIYVLYYNDKNTELKIEKILNKYELLVTKMLNAIERKYFKTKSQALAYAKSYMRKN